MNKNHFTDLLSCADFKSLFNEMGWDHPAVREDILLTLDEQEWVIREVAQKCGFHAYVCETGDLPQHALHRKLDVQLRRYGNDYLIVFVKSGEPFRHQWMVPVKTVEKRELVIVEYEKADQTAFLFEKTEAVSFGLTEQVSIVDVTARVHSVFTVNAARITKDFYTGFRKQHEAFAKFIEGIPESSAADRPWFASVMLNRLMFCYFIQKKGFLNLDPDYLQNKLRETQEHCGRDAFFGSFYKKFLRVLFRDGLNAPRHDAAFEKTFGRIPYLNGGLFERHAIENDCPDLDIPDRAFEDLFAFFDKWRWHLDTRMTASGRDINPDVLGYIFEQYINDRAQMGAYYTKEDITEYIAKNCIVPFLFDAVSRTDSARHFKPGGFVWHLMRDSGDAFIYPAVKKGVDLPLPPEIERGVAVETAPGEPPLRERRAAWNTPADARYALPTEIWRETVARRQRCEDLRRKIAAGEIASVSDLVTGNLDIRRFTEDVLEKTDDHLLIRHFYDALRAITVLDPTCGSGAFLFAALNVLEPLYEICIARMQKFHEGNKNLFKDELSEIENKYRSNIQHYIYKSIILRNLYGVDIMREATEIAKLRLFLKMVAVVDVDKRAENLGLDPLPDIDFNIRCGNTLVGFANEEEILAHFQNSDEALFAVQHRDEIREQCELVAQAFKRFKEIQLSQSDAHQTFVAAKTDLKTRLGQLREKLDGLSATFAQTNPFHWIAEFYGIVQEHGGFDVIIGNPPYVEYRLVKSSYKLQPMVYRSEDANNLYAYCMERSIRCLDASGYLGMIVPSGLLTVNDTVALRSFLTETCTQMWCSTYAIRPSKLFEGAEQRLCIFVAHKSCGPTKSLFSSSYRHWNIEERQTLFSTLVYAPTCYHKRLKRIAQVGTVLSQNVFGKLESSAIQTISSCFSISADSIIMHYHRSPRYWIRAINFEPYFKSPTKTRSVSHFRDLHFKSESIGEFITALLNSSLFFYWFVTIGNGRNITETDVAEMPIGDVEDCICERITVLFKKLMADYNRNSFVRVRKDCEFQEFQQDHSKPIIDEIDTVLAKHYGFTDEELDFIINYDIKYRMGDELNEREVQIQNVEQQETPTP